MPEQPATHARQISGDEIISELLRNSEAGQFKIRQTAILPSIYHVYLHPADFESIRVVIPALIAEARAALIEQADQFNRRAKPSPIARALGSDAAGPVTYKILDPDWTIEFHPDAEDKLTPGEMEIYSDLASAPQPEFEGAMTRHVTRRRADASRTEATATVPLAQASAQTTVFARLRYEDASGAKVFEISKNTVVVGRGGKAYWVDLKLDAPPDVSREHCRLRRDPATGRPS